MVERLKPICELLDLAESCLDLKEDEATIWAESSRPDLVASGRTTLDRLRSLKPLLERLQVENGCEPRAVRVERLAARTRKFLPERGAEPASHMREFLHRDRPV